MLPIRPLNVHPKDLASLNPGDAEARLQSWDDGSVGGASIMSVFDCQHGCFSPDHSIQHCDHHRDSQAGNCHQDLQGCDASSRGQNTKCDQQSRTYCDHVKSYPGFSDHILVPIGEPSAWDLSRNVQDNVYQEQSHCSQTGQRYKVKTRDTIL